MGAAVNEFYGLTEVNHLVGNCSVLWPVRPGFMGARVSRPRGVGGGRSGRAVKAGVEGQIVVRHGDPRGFSVTGKPRRTRRMFLGGPTSRRLDHDGRHGGAGRGRLFPLHGAQRRSHQERRLPHRPCGGREALLAMEVAEAAVIAAPDAAGAIVKALVRLAAGVVPSGHSGRGSGST